MIRLNTFASWAVLMLVLSFLGCAALGPIQQRAHEQVRPQSLPVRNITSFTPALHCMDSLLARYYPPGQPAVLYSKGVIDKTGKNIGSDNREILMSTIAEMSARSNLFQVADLPTTVHDLQVTGGGFFNQQTPHPIGKKRPHRPQCHRHCAHGQSWGSGWTSLVTNK